MKINEENNQLLNDNAQNGDWKQMLKQEINLAIRNENMWFLKNIETEFHSIISKINVDNKNNNSNEKNDTALQTDAHQF